MGKKTISFDLSVHGIERAIKELRQYAQDLDRKIKLLRERVAEEIAWSASRGFSSSLADDLVTGETRLAQVEVSVDEREHVTVVFAEGPDAVFVEFGAGVSNNGTVGSSPHPKGAEFGFTIGSYGKGKGSKKVWGFYDGDAVRLTRGTPAAMPMYRGAREACAHLEELAKEIFGT